MRQPIFLASCLLAVIPVAMTAAAAQILSLEPYARMNHVYLDEVSGMVKSRTRDDLYWVVNDSGDEARVFAIRSDGSSVIPTYSRFSRWADTEESGKQPWNGFRVLYATNVDWEDMTVDDEYLYIADMGNNANIRDDLVIYAIGEIDPTASTQAAVVKKFPVRYPDQQAFPPVDRHFDSESLFSADGSLYVITKHRGGLMNRLKPGANLYRLDTEYTDQVNELVRVDGNDDMTAATSAELSPDGGKLAVLTYGMLWVFDRPAVGDAWLSSSFRNVELDTERFLQVETVTWEDDNTLIVTNEQRDMFRVLVDRMP